MAKGSWGSPSELSTPYPWPGDFGQGCNPIRQRGVQWRPDADRKASRIGKYACFWSIAIWVGYPDLGSHQDKA